MAGGQDLYYVSKGRVKITKHVSLAMTVKKLIGNLQVVSIPNRFRDTISYNELLEMESSMALRQGKKGESRCYTAK